MSFFRMFALAARLIRQILRDKRTLILIFIVPIVLMTLLSLVLTNTSTVHTLALVRPSGAQNASINTLIDTLLPPASKLKVVSIGSDRVDTTLQNGDAAAVLIFPADLAQQLSANQRPTIQTVLEGSDPSVASAMRDVTDTIAHQLSIALAASSTTSIHSQSPASNQASIFSLSAPRYLYGGANYTFNDSLAPVFIGIFSFFFVFLLTSVAFLRERSQGTLERVLVSPLKRTELVLGYVSGFTLFALVQSLVILLFVVFALHIHYRGNLSLVFLVTVLLTVGSVNLGIFLSTFARNEFQVVQFIPLVLGIQLFLSGVFWPVAQLPALLRPISYILPLTYANDALRGVMLKGQGFSDIALQLAALLVFALLMIVLSALTTGREAI